MTDQAARWKTLKDAGLITQHGQFFQLLLRKDGSTAMRCGVCRRSFITLAGTDSLEARSAKTHVCAQNN